MLEDDIRSYLNEFVENLKNENSPDNSIALRFVIARISQRVENEKDEWLKPFEQNLKLPCKKCRLSFEEIGSITRRKYRYCIYSGEKGTDVPIGCPRVGDIRKGPFVQAVSDEDDIIEIRRKGTC